MTAENRYYATGKRKNAVARVWMSLARATFRSQAARGRYFGRETLQMVVQQPLKLTGHGRPVDFYILADAAASPARRSRPARHLQGP